MRREDGEMDKALLRNIPKVDELLAPVRALCPNASSAAVTATPMISNRIPVSTMQIRTTNDRISPAPSSKLDDTKLMSAEIRTVTRKISAIHLKSGRADLPVFFFFAAAKAASKIMLTI